MIQNEEVGGVEDGGADGLREVVVGVRTGLVTSLYRDSGFGRPRLKKGAGRF